MAASALLASGVAGFAPEAHAQIGSDDPGIAVAGQFVAPLANDIIVGQNKTGPYSLAWNKVLIDFNHPMSVQVDGVTLTDDSYTLDATKGVITFTQALKSTSMARIYYYYNPAVAKRNADYVQTPVSAPLLQMDGTNFGITTLSGTSSSTGATQLVYGLDRQTSLLGGGLATKLMATDGGTAYNVGYKYGTPHFGFDTTYSRTEKDFASRVGKPLNLASAQDQLALGTHFKPTNFLGFGTTISEQQDLVTRIDKVDHGLTMNVGGAVPTQPVLNFSTLQDLATTPTHVTTDTTTDKLDLTAKVGSAATLVAKGQQVVTDVPGGTGDTTAQDASVALTEASKDKKQQVSLTVSDSDHKSTTVDNGTQDVLLKVQPNPVVTVSAEQKDIRTDTAAVAGATPATVVSTAQSSLGAEFDPVKTTKLTGTVSSVLQGDTHTEVTDLGAAVGTTKAVELGGGITDRSNTTAGAVALDSWRANLALRPYKTLTVTGGYTVNPVANGVVQDATRQDIGLTTKVGGLDLGSAYSLTTVNGIATGDEPDPQIGQVKFTLGLKVDRFTSLKGNYQDSLFYGNAYSDAQTVVARGSRVYGLNLSHSLGPTLNVSLDGAVTRQYVLPTPVPGYKATATIGAKF